jgi:predicted small secreted protein
MKKDKVLFAGILVIMLVFSLALSGCATISSIGGTVDSHGLISKAKEVTTGATEIASYSVILSIIDSGYPEYAAAVKQAEAARKQITTVTTSYVFFVKVRAYAK